MWKLTLLCWLSWGQVLQVSNTELLVQDGSLSCDYTGAILTSIIQRNCSDPTGNVGTRTIKLNPGSGQAAFDNEIQPSGRVGMQFNLTLTGVNYVATTGLGITATLGTFMIPSQPPPTPVITGPAALPQGTAGVPYPSTAFTATSGVPPYSWSAAGLPTGLGITSGGSLSGTPAAAGSFSPSFTVIDSAGGTSSVTLHLTVAAAVTVPALISHASASASGTAMATTPAINTTGATLLVMMATDFSQNSTADVHTDSKGNAWTALPLCATGTNDMTAWYSFNPMTGTAHTFSAKGSYTSFAVTALSGVSGIRLPATCATSGTSSTLAISATATAPSLLLTFIAHAYPTPSVAGGFTLLDFQPYGSFEGIAVAYKIQSAAGSDTATWTNSAGQTYPGMMLVIQ